MIDEDTIVRHYMKYRKLIILTMYICYVGSSLDAIAQDASAGGAEDRSIVAPIARNILEPGATQSQVRAYCEAKIPSIPRFETVLEWEAYSADIRRRMLDDVVLRGAAKGWSEARCRVERIGTIPGGAGYKIHKLRYEAIPGFWIPALLYEPDKLEGEVPVVLNVNGHEPAGKAAPYKQIRCVNQAKRGMIALNVEWIDMGQLHVPGNEHDRLVAVDLCGTSGIAIYYLAIERAIDILLSHPHADRERVAMTGLSGGGWQSIFAGGLDPRIKLCNPVAGYSSFKTRVRVAADLGDFEQTPCDMATVADYTHLTALRAPRPTLLTFNIRDDCCFRADHALQPLLDAATPIFRLYGKQADLRSHVNQDPGTHNFDRDNREALYQMFGEYFFSGQPFDSSEIFCEPELKTKNELAVALPDDNKTLKAIATDLARDLPRVRPNLGVEAKVAAIRSIVRSTAFQVEGERVRIDEQEGERCESWRLKLGAWTIPAVVIDPKNARETAVVLADAGRGSSSKIIRELLDGGRRVVAVDPLNFGESRYLDHGYLYNLLLTTIGERPLGLEASELAATARWARSRESGLKVTIEAIGPRASLVALVAAAIEPKAIASVHLTGSLKSLKEIVHRDLKYEDYPELYCFGLLESFDVGDLIELVHLIGVKTR